MLLPGVHRLERPQVLSRPVRLSGERSGGGARLFGRLRITASRVHLEDLRISGGLDLRFADRVTVATSTLSAGGGATTVSAVGTSVRLSRCRIEAGRDGALQVSTSTVQIDRSRIVGGPAARVVAAHRSVVSLERVGVTGGGSAQYRLDASTLQMTRVHSSESDGNGVVLFGGSSGRARASHIVDLQGTAVTVRNAEWAQDGGELHSRGDVTASTVGGSLNLRGVRIRSGPRGGVHALGTRLRPAFASLADCAVDVPADGPGLYAESATVALDRVRVETSSSARLEARTLVEVAGPQTHLRLDDVQLVGGQGLSVSRGAHVVARGLTLGPGFGGVYARGASVDLQGVTARGMVGAPAIWATDSSLSVRTATVASCVAGGIGVGAWSRAEVSDLWATRSLPYALSAVERTDLSLARARLEGRPWAIYTDCTGTVETSSVTLIDGARVRHCPR